MADIKEWFSKNIAILGWFVSVAITYILTRFILLANNLLTELNFLFLLLIIAVGIAVTLYINDFNSKYFRYFDFIQSMPTETTSIKFQKRVIFNAESLKAENLARVETIRIIQNNMKRHTYNLFQIKIESGVFVPHVRNMTINVNGKDLNPEKDVVKPKLFAQFYNENDTNAIPAATTPVKKAPPVKMIKEFFVPVDIPPNETCTTTIGYRTGAYVKAIESENDWISLECNRLTKEMIFEISLEGDIKISHKLSRVRQRDDYNQIIEFLVFDASNERMVSTEFELKEQKIIPKYSDNMIQWKIPTPKVGYLYRLYFTLLPKNNGSSNYSIPATTTSVTESTIVPEGTPKQV